MTRTWGASQRFLLLLVAVATIVLVALPPALGSADQRDKSAPAAGQCTGAGGSFAWDQIWRDGSPALLPGSQGYMCGFEGVHYTDLQNRPGVRGWQNKCEKVYGGHFYWWDPGFPSPGEAGYGCQWLYD